MEVFAVFNIFNDIGEKVAEGHKASFCLEDNQCKPGVERKFACANYGDQGKQLKKLFIQNVKYANFDRHQHRLLRYLQVQYRLPVGGHHRAGAGLVHDAGVHQSRVQGG